MSFAGLAFLNPWVLTALASLPLIYWLLRTVPPRPRQIAFPPTRILIGIENKEKTPARTPWWLLLIRLLAAALLILALAEPVLNPRESTALKGSGPVVIVLDNGWASGARWSDMTAMAARTIDDAERQMRPVVLAATAPAAKTMSVKVEPPTDARSTLAALQPQPFAPSRMTVADSIGAALSTTERANASAIWITDGIDHGGKSAEFASKLAATASGAPITLVELSGPNAPLGLAASVTPDGGLQARLLRTSTGARQGTVHALSARSQRLGEANFNFLGEERETTVTFQLPLELRNQVTRIEIAGERSAGAVSLLDQRSQWQRVGLISGEAQERAQPLLAPLYYLERAIKPFTEIVSPGEKNLSSGISRLIDDRASLIMLADIGTIAGEAKEKLAEWIGRGGVLVRFAGPRLEKGGDDLLPVALRVGGRTLGGALSWSSPQPLAPFDDNSLFAGLQIPADVTIRRQVLADPAMLTPAVKVWARLQDGTPLVTAERRGEGHVVLFHVTANADWSNLPMSGLFVEMLRRITQLGNLTGPPSTGAEPSSSTRSDTSTARTTSGTGDLLAPTVTLDGFGVLRSPPPTAQAIAASKADTAEASLDHPPGYYGTGASPRAINAVRSDAKLEPIGNLPVASQRRGYDSQASLDLKPWLILAALGLLLADIVAVIVLMGGLALLSRPRAPQTTAVLALALASGLTWSPEPADAQDFDLPSRFIFPGREESRPTATTIPAEIAPADQIPVRATSKVTFAYVLTGDPAVDETSRLGLKGLVRTLKSRTAVEPGEPMAVDIVNDEIVFFPVLYWPVLDTAQALPAETLAKIDAYMKQGGMIIFDTRDYGRGLPSGMAMAGERGPVLQRLIGALDLPRLEPVPEDHVLTKAFYLLQSFPGRWDGGELWVEAQEDREEPGSEAISERRARRADGVTSIMITPNDFASAWAVDERGKPVYPVVPGGERQREMAMRTGVNIVMHALTGNYKADQVHVPALLERLGQ